MIDELILLERRRCEAVAHDDVVTLRELLAPTLKHVHTRGNLDSLESYLEYLATRVEILDVRRSDLEVSLYDGCAVMTGHQTNTARPRGSNDDPIQVEAQVMQVWVRTGDRWKQVAFQATPVGGPPPALPPIPSPT